MINSNDTEILHRRLEEQQIRIKALEHDIKELTSQNYDLMTRISQLCDKLRAKGSILKDLV